MAESVKNRTNRNPSSHYNVDYDDTSPNATRSNKSRVSIIFLCRELTSKQLMTI
jgi:hypothetical protein